MANNRDPQTNAAAFLGAELRRARPAAGITSQDKLGQMLGYDRSVIAKAETGERPPSEDVMKPWSRRSAWTRSSPGSRRWPVSPPGFPPGSWTG
jgi:hypothetical protein